MSHFVEYSVVFFIIALAVYYTWTRVLFKKSKSCSSGCGKCGS
ncbi:FeoB-associated Cys-rich membrane protein [Psychrobacter sp. UBA3962]